MNKKAAISLPGQPFSFILFGLFLLVWVLFLLIIVGVHGCQISENTGSYYSSKSAQMEVNIMLQNIIQTPVLIDGVNMTLGDLGILALSNPEAYNDAFENQIRIIFDNFPPNAYVLKIKKDDREKMFGFINKDIAVYPDIKSSAIFPAPDKTFAEFNLYVHLYEQTI